MLNIINLIFSATFKMDISALLVGGVKSHFYCLPTVKRETHRLALIEAATSGSPKFFAGIDSAPHTTSTK